jgi:hypothetical protein
MKRMKTGDVLAAISRFLAGIGAVPTKRPQSDAEPFPGARVILDDAAWQSLWPDQGHNGDYEWVPPNALVCFHRVYWKWQFFLYRLLPEGTFSAPQPLNPLIEPWEQIRSISPDGTTLCVYTLKMTEFFPVRLVRLEGDGKPITFESNYYSFHWSPDSRLLYGIAETTDGYVLERIDTETGTKVKTSISVPKRMRIHSVTPEGKLLFHCRDANDSVDPQMRKWWIGELHDSTVHVTSYQKWFPDKTVVWSLSPDGKRLLWEIFSEEYTFWERIQNKVFGKPLPLIKGAGWQITDADGSNPHTLGSISEKEMKSLNRYPQWMPDSEGIHFVYEKKLWRLDVP